MVESFKVKILFLLPALTVGGAERSLLTLMNSAHRAGYDVQLVSMKGPGGLNSWVADGIPVFYPAPRRLLAGLPSLIRMIWKSRPDIIIATLVPVNMPLLALRLFLPRTTRIVVREASIPTSLMNTSFRKHTVGLMYKKLYPKADIVISPTKVIIEDFSVRVGMKTDNHIVLPNPVNIKHIRNMACRDFQVSPSPQYVRFVCVGRLDRAKGYDRLIESLADLPADKGWSLTIWGEGSECPVLEELVRRQGLQERVLLPGHTDNPWAPLAEADVCLLPSRWEGLPNVALEALAVGTPVIAMAEAGGIFEIAEPANRKNPAAIRIANTMEEFIAAMAEVMPSGHQAVRDSLMPSRFEQENIEDEFEALIEKVLAG